MNLGVGTRRGTKISGNWRKRLGETGGNNDKQQQQPYRPSTSIVKRLGGGILLLLLILGYTFRGGGWGLGITPRKGLKGLICVYIYIYIYTIN